ncbi:XRE family transcriptional regulator [Streptomyces sp. SYP-A7185]|uniref:XRE family transcriptional regulator n=1 Tax=Streptomyces sp. SYP-A7185 TaxID=3040076 RepID=UPI0038F60D1C
MGNLGDSPLHEDASPHDIRDVAGFIASMRRLKERSGLTYRELEERAALGGDVLARSTLADVLRRTSLPRPEVLAAFVRACGDSERLDAWLAARDRLAAGRGTDEDDTAVSVPVRSRRVTVAVGLGLAALVVPFLGWGAWVLFGGDSAESGASDAPADGWVTIRPARSAELCLTDGRDRAGRYESAVAVQLPCAQAPVPRTYLEQVGAGRYRIQWHHPEMGKGCLAVMGGDQIKGMIEPRQNCAQATVFRVEPDGEGAFSLRPDGDGGRCIGIVDGLTTAGAEAIEERCADGAADQRFLVRAS